MAQCICWTGATYNCKACWPNGGSNGEKNAFFRAVQEEREKVIRQECEMCTNPHIMDNMSSNERRSLEIYSLCKQLDGGSSNFVKQQTEKDRQYVDRLYKAADEADESARRTRNSFISSSSGKNTTNPTNPTIRPTYCIPSGRDAGTIGPKCSNSNCLYETTWGLITECKKCESYLCNDCSSRFSNYCKNCT